MRAALPDISEEDRWSYAVEIDLLVNYSVTWKIQVLLKVNSNNIYQIKKKVNYNSKMVVYFPECSAESHTKVLPWQHLAPETITVKALKIVIFGKDKNCQTKPVTETSLQTLSEEWPWRDSWLGDHNNRPRWKGKIFKARTALVP